MTDMRRYADLYASLDVLKPFDTSSRQSAFMLSGEDPDGLGVLARILAARLCGIDYTRAFEEHADIMVYPRAATDADDKKSKKGKKADKAKAAPINVEEVNDIINSLYLTPFELDRRVYIIENAESMSDVCQNKLLKSLEEPPPRVCFILCAAGALLPTVESRCTNIELPPFAVSTVYERLKDNHDWDDDRDVMLAARASRGNLGMAERMLADTDSISAYADALKILRLATGSRAFAHVAAVYEKYTRERVAVTLGHLEYLFGDIARLLSGAETVFDAKDINSIAVGFTPYAAAMCAEHVRSAQKRVRANCMPQAVLDGLVLKIMEEKALCRR